jgi:hypothetical protein
MPSWVFEIAALVVFEVLVLEVLDSKSFFEVLAFEVTGLNQGARSSVRVPEVLVEWLFDPSGTPTPPGA